MKRETGRYKTFTRRSAMLVGGQGLLLSALVGRLYYLQVVRSEEYRMLADENRISLRLLVPPRGLIVDRYGQVVAGNMQNYRVLLVPEQAKRTGEKLTVSADRTLLALSKLIPLDDFQRQKVLREVGRKREFVPINVAGNLTWEDFSRINVHAPDLPGIVPDVGETRQYPLGPILAHVVGYVAPVADTDTIDDPLLDLPGFRIGRSGVERKADLTLRGKAGSSHVEVNAHGRVIRELKRVAGHPGREVTITIDAQLQEFATNRMGAESAGAAVIDISNGDVLALVSTPSFDPTQFAFGLSRDEWNTLVNNPRKPLLNKAVTGQYPPGSTFKMMVALAALENGAIHTGHRVFCPGHTVLGDRKFHCWKKGGHGELTLTEGIEQSCDVFFYDVARRVGIDKIAEMATRFGLGSTPDLGLGTERPGLIPTADWKFKRTGERWQAGETLVAGIGQGFILTTPLQLAAMTGMVANGGIRITPRLIVPPDEAGRASVRPDLVLDPEADPRSLKISAGSMAAVREGMVRVVNSARGTAYAARIRDKGFEMAGKSGTAQVRGISVAERDEGLPAINTIPWEQRDHALFVGFAPMAAPRYACAVVVEHGGGGSLVCGPMVRDILLQVQKLDSGRKLRRQVADVAPPKG
ncbi:MAG: penicillin-binding protein 2 [Alphaproteobacteria bacterium]|nr:penicillin-binding protein 2 [Alphaproteobacteria bacterium]